MDEKSGTVIETLFGNVATILGFGFLGLSFLMLFLAYRAFNDIAKKENPKPEVVRLARQFLWTSLAFLVAAGPLHLALLWGQSNFAPKVNVKIALSTAIWDLTDGEVGVVYQGAFRQIPVDATIGADETILINLDKVRRNIDTMRAQISTATEAALARSGGPGHVPISADPEPVPPADDAGSTARNAG
jgi:hypothetical protein